MVLDYSGRRPVPRNRPRKQPTGIFAVILISAISMSFALGVLSGWFIFRPGRNAAPSQPAPVRGAPGTPAAVSRQAASQNPEAAARGAEPPLTFYETLPKGGKAIIGSGLNPRRTEDPRVQKPAPPATVPLPQPAVQQPTTSPVVEKAEEHKEQGKTPAERGKKSLAGEPAPATKQPGAPGKFCVQIASTRERQEAESLKGKLVEKGFPVSVTESKIKDRGTWYRVRVGKHLSQQAAGELAARMGKGALVIPE